MTREPLDLDALEHKMLYGDYTQTSDYEHDVEVLFTAFRATRAALAQTEQARAQWLAHAQRDADEYRHERDEARAALAQADRSRAAMYADMDALLAALGVPNTARPESPHLVMLDAVAAVQRLRAALAQAEQERDVLAATVRRGSQANYALQQQLAAYRLGTVRAALEADPP